MQVCLVIRAYFLKDIAFKSKIYFHFVIQIIGKDGPFEFKNLYRSKCYCILQKLVQSRANGTYGILSLNQDYHHMWCNNAESSECSRLPSLVPSICLRHWPAMPQLIIIQRKKIIFSLIYYQN